MFTALKTNARTALACTLLAGMALGLGACNRTSTTTTPTTTTTKASAGDVGTASALPFPVVHEDWAKIGYRLDWVGFPFPTATGRTKVNFLNVYDDVLVIEQSDSTVSLLETSNGQTRWSTQLAGPLTKFVGINRDPSNPNNIYVSSESEMYTVSAANGSLLARDRFNRVVNTAPIIHNNTAIFGCSTGEVMGHVIGRGVKAWGFMSSGAIEADPVEVDQAVAFVSQSGDVLFFAKAGGLVGRAAIYSGLANDPVAENGLLFVAGRDRSIWAFNSTGNQEWRHRTSSPLTAQPTAHKGVLYVSIPSEGLTAFEQATGKVLWKNANVNGTVIATRGGRLLVQTDKELVTLQPQGGEIVERIPTQGMVRFVTDKFDDGNLYVVSDKANLAKFTPR